MSQPTSPPSVRRVPVGEHMGVEVGIHDRLPDPTESFYADHIEVVAALGGKRLLAIRVHPFAPNEVLDTLEFVFEERAFEEWIKSIAGIAQELISSSPSADFVAPFQGERSAVRPRLSVQVMTAHVATTNGGLTIDLYQFPAVSMLRALRNVDPLPQVEPRYRVETLPGRLNHLLGARNG